MQSLCKRKEKQGCKCTLLFTFVIAVIGHNNHVVKGCGDWPFTLLCDTLPLGVHTRVNSGQKSTHLSIYLHIFFYPVSFYYCFIHNIRTTNNTCIHPKYKKNHNIHNNLQHTKKDRPKINPLPPLDQSSLLGILSHIIYLFPYQVQRPSTTFSNYSRFSLGILYVEKYIFILSDYQWAIDHLILDPDLVPFATLMEYLSILETCYIVPHIA